MSPEQFILKAVCNKTGEELTIHLTKPPASGIVIGIPQTDSPCLVHFPSPDITRANMKICSSTSIIIFDSHQS